MDSELRALRKYILDHFHAQSTPPVIEEVMRKFGVSRPTASESLRMLEAEHHILLVPETVRILMANPYSAVTTPFRVEVGGRKYYANCAWDTISMHVMLDSTANIESYCHHCAAPISLTMSGGKVASSGPSEPLIFLSTPVSRWYDNLIDTCSNNMVYFASREHMADWLTSNPGLRGESLSPEMIAKVCRPLSEGRMDLEYERPSRAVLMSHWESLGYAGDFWKL